jgi:hypothetical protein
MSQLEMREVFTSCLKEMMAEDERIVLTLPGQAAHWV